MTLLDAIIATGGALQRHKLRSCLTALGIIIGTSATITMMAIGAGAREQVAAQVRSLGTNLLIVMPGNANQSGVRLGAGAAPSLTEPLAGKFDRFRRSRRLSTEISRLSPTPPTGRQSSTL